MAHEVPDHVLNSTSHLIQNTQASFVRFEPGEVCESGISDTITRDSEEVSPFDIVRKKWQVVRTKC